MKKIFISSVQKEFAEERKLLKRYISKNPAYRRLFDTFVFEEDVVAADRRTDEVYIDELRKCDVYIGLIGSEYGFEDSEGVSPTEREYDEATRLGLTRLVFVLEKNGVKRYSKEEAFLKKISASIIRAKCDDSSALLLEIYASLDGLLVEQGAYAFLPFEATPCEGATLKDISRSKVREFIVAAKIKRGLPLAQNIAIEDFLRHFHLLSFNGVPLNSAILLFGRNPQSRFLTSQVKCVQWPTSERKKPIKDHRIITGTLFEMADEAVAFVLDKLEKWIGARDSGVGAVAPTGFDIPRAVVLEAIVNAIAHRDYDSNASVQVELFPDKLLVMSPGNPHPSVDVANLDKPHPSTPVNPLIADALYQTGHIERLGTGLEDLFITCKSMGLPKPKIEQIGGVFHITIFRNVKGGVPVNVPVNVSVNVPVKVSLTEQIYALIKDNPGLNRISIAERLGVEVRTVARHLSLLRGRIEFRGAPKTGGYWHIDA